MTVTSFWLVFPPVYRKGREREEMLHKESEAVATIFLGAKLISIGYA
jgi:hypothetical protein